MTTNDIKNVQILANLKNGEKLIGVTEDKIVINTIAGFVKFVQVNEEKFDSLCGLNRVKEDWKYRPFKDIEECFEEMKKHSPFGWICNVNDGYNLIVFLNDGDICFGEEWVSYQEAFKRGYTFMDGSPFGIKEEEES